MNTTTHRLIQSLSHDEKVSLSADYARLLTRVRQEELLSAHLDGDFLEVVDA